MVLTETQVYLLGAGVSALLFVAAGFLASRYNKTARVHAGAVASLLLVLFGGYAGMANGWLSVTSATGTPVLFPRYIMNVVAFSFALGYAALIAGANFRLRMLTIGILSTTNVATPIIQLTDGIISSVFNLISLVSLAAAFWLFFRPLTRASETVSRERALLFRKLRNLTVLGYLTYFLVSLVARGGAGLLDDFISVAVTGYTDFVIISGLVFIILQSRVAVQHMAQAYSSPLQVFVPKK